MGVKTGNLWRNTATDYIGRISHFYGEVFYGED